jgi:hypothetical protein
MLQKKTVSQIIQDIVAGRKYFSVIAIKQRVKTSRCEINNGTVNQYLYDMRKRGEIYNAGRGWYSSIPEQFHPAKQFVEPLVFLISKKYPLLSFSIWSTEQLQPFAHHLMTSFTKFIYTDVDAMPSIVGLLKDEGYQSYLNPQKKEAEKYFDPSTNAIVVRTAVTREPVEGFFATAEKILVDLFIEKDRLSLMDGAEYKRVFRNLVSANRINIAKFLEYAERRKIKVALIQNILSVEKDIFLCSGS